MKLTRIEEEMLEGVYGRAARKSMQVLKTLGEIYGADRLIEVGSAQISGVSYANLGPPGLEFLEEMAGDGRCRVLATLNPAGMDLENWRRLGISPGFAEKQRRVIEAYERMGAVSTCTCTPYLIGNLPRFGEHIAWSESSAVCYANSVLGARTNREGGPSALAAALTGKTPKYGLHLEENRHAEVTVQVSSPISETHQYGALGKAIGDRAGRKIPYIKGVTGASLEELKSFCASLATYGGTAMFHMEGITPEYEATPIPEKTITIGKHEVEKAVKDLSNEDESDFISVGCPHCSLRELARIAELLRGRKVKRELWITTSRQMKEMADRIGYSSVIEEAGGKLACDTCFIVAPIQGRFKGLSTDSAKGCFYARGNLHLHTRLRSLEDCVEEALR